MGRAPCCDNAGDRNKGAWTKEEDDKLIRYIQTHGEGCWRSLPKAAGLLRCGKSCRLRWINYLRPDLKRGNFSEEEEDLIFKLHALLGNKWSLIAGRLPGRTDNEIKNYWNSHLKRKLLSRGVDPLNHRPLHTKTADIRRPSTQLSDITRPQTREEGNKCSCDTTVDDVSESKWEQHEVTSEHEIVPNLNLELSITSPPFTNPSNVPPVQSKQDSYTYAQTQEDGQNTVGCYGEMPRTMLLLI